jgi:hypothetical protein
MKGYLDEKSELSAAERDRLRARFEAYAQAAETLRRLVEDELEPRWASQLEVES